MASEAIEYTLVAGLNPSNGEHREGSTITKLENSLRGDLRWRTIPGLLTAAASAFGDRPAIVDGQHTLSFRALLDESGRFARALVATGVERGDRVAILGPNRWEWVVAALGAHFAGAALVPINTRYKGLEAAGVLAEAEPKVLVMTERLLDIDYPRLLADAGFPAGERCFAVMMDGASASGPGFEEFCHRADGAPETALDERVASLDPSDHSDILFTSGTTGSPKGVITDHGQNLRAYYDWATISGMREGDRYAIIPPFFHAFGSKVGWLSCLMHGITMYPHAVLDVPRLLDQIATEGITILPGPPALYISILEHPERDRHDLSSLRLAIIGAATIPPALVRRMRDELGFDRITTCYGLTEATGIATITRAEDPLETVLTTAGRALPDVEVRVAGEDGSPRAQGEGEVVIRGYNVMRGYVSGASPPVDADGWLRTGDIGILDDDGYLRITDRKKDMFIVGGFNVSPAEVEKAMSEHPGIEQVAVVGVPDDRMGEVGMAFVVPRQPAPAADEIIEWTRERLANYKVPRHIALVAELPRNATGKVLKHELRARAERAEPIR